MCTYTPTVCPLCFCLKCTHTHTSSVVFQCKVYSSPVRFWPNIYTHTPTGLLLCFCLKCTFSHMLTCCVSVQGVHSHTYNLPGLQDEAGLTPLTAHPIWLEQLCVHTGRKGPFRSVTSVLTILVFVCVDFAWCLCMLTFRVLVFVC